MAPDVPPDLRRLLVDEASWFAQVPMSDDSSTLRVIVGELMIRNGIGHDLAQTAVASVLLREKTRPTGIGHGLIIPHGKIGGLNKFYCAWAGPSPGSTWTHIHESGYRRGPAQLLFCLVGPADRTAEHIKILAWVCRAMYMDVVRSALYAAFAAATTTEDLRGAVVKHLINRA